ncbi:MAG: aminotransferase class IV [Campylobacteraceae bacterium]|nr:aminotransferase class IV [Campylobacteraceae bacterium]
MQDYFETIKCDDSEVYHLPYHNKRISNTVSLNLNLSEYIYAPNNKLLKCKVIYNEEGIKEVTYTEYKKREISTFKLIFDDTIDYHKKNLDREDLDKLFEKKEKADEIIIIKNNLVTDTSIANIVIFDGTSWLTPKVPLLFGTTRARLLAQNDIIEANITVDMLLKSEKLALLNAMIGMDIKKDYSFLL